MRSFKLGLSHILASRLRLRTDKVSTIFISEPFFRRYFWESILAGKVVRLIYRGQLLRDDTRSLLSYGLHDQCVVHCHVSSTPYAQPSSSSANASVENNALLREATGLYFL